MKLNRLILIVVLLVLALSISPTTYALTPPAIPPAQGPQGSGKGELATMSAPMRVQASVSNTPPELTEAQKAVLAQREARGPLPAATALSLGNTAAHRPDSVVDPRTATGGQQANAPTTPGTFTLFRNNDYGATIKSNTSGATGEPNAANSGPIVFSTGNWWAAISANGGQTFSFVNPYTMFPTSYGGFCCDQKMVYDPSRDIFIWSLQYISSGAPGAGQNIFRIAVARPKDAVIGSWYYYDFASAVNTEWDYPELCLSNDFVYYTTNRGVFNSGSVNDAFVFRFPLDPLSTGAGMGYTYWDVGTISAGNLSLTCTQGARDVVYFGSHNTTSQIRIFNVPENSASTMYWNDVNLSVAWPNATRACPTPDGRDWCGFDDGRMKAGWVSRSMIGFLWNASAGSGFAVPYTEAVRVKEADRTYIDRPLIWNPTTAFQYAAAAPNRRGDVGIVVHSSSSTVYPGFWVGIDDDYSRDAGYGPPGWELLYVRQGTQGPNTNRWGDYYSVRSFEPNGLGWVGTGASMQGCGVAGCKETRYVLYGRERDLRGIQNYYNPTFGLALPLIVR